MYYLLTALPALFFWGILLFSMHIDRRRFRNSFFLMGALISTIPVLTVMAGRYGAILAVILSLFIMVALLLVPVLLIANGIIMVMKEGRRFKNLLSLFLGLIIGIGELATFYTLLSNSQGRRQAPALIVLSAAVGLTVIYFSLLFLCFVTYTVFIQIIPRRKDFDYVIIHGAGLLSGSRISPLLAGRLDKAIDVYRKDPTPPYMIPSGGKGSDESVSEGEAMQAYLLEKGIPADMILAETGSATTMENLKNSKLLIEKHLESQGKSADSAYIALISSNYHVYRCLSYCRKIGITCTGIGSRTAGYYYPSAMIREFAAICAEKRHIRLLIIGWVVSMVPVLALGIHYLGLF